MKKFIFNTFACILLILVSLCPVGCEYVGKNGPEFLQNYPSNTKFVRTSQDQYNNGLRGSTALAMAIMVAASFVIVLRNK